MKGRVEFHAELHDDGEKQVLGRWFPAGLGAKDVDLLIDLVADHPSTASHLATKLCRRFIADEPPPAAVALVADAFTASGGDIAATVRALLRCAEFRAEDPSTAVRGGKLKRPFHYLASCLRACDADSDAGPALTQYLARMGHAPFQFPTPDGYPEVAGAWRGTLLWRWQLADTLAGNRVAGTRIERELLTTRAGGHEGLAAHLLGRRPDAAEREALRAGDDPLALLLASPAFQRC